MSRKGGVYVYAGNHSMGTGLRLDQSGDFETRSKGVTTVGFSTRSKTVIEDNSISNNESVDLSR